MTVTQNMYGTLKELSRRLNSRVKKNKKKIQLCFTQTRTVLSILPEDISTCIGVLSEIVSESQ